MTFGALFILFGSYSGLHYSAASNTCDGANCASQLGDLLINDANTSADTQADPTVDLISDIPNQITNDEVVLINTTNTARIVAQLRFTNESGSTATQQVQAARALNNRYRITIPGRDLEPNQYTLRVQLYDMQDQSYGYTTLGSFSVPATESAGVVQQSVNTTSTDLIQPPDDTTESTGLINTSETIAAAGDLIDTTTEPVEAVDLINTSYDSSEQTSSAGSFITDSSVVSDVVSTTDGLVQAAAPTSNQLTISANSVVSGRAEINIQSTVTQILSVYIRRLQSTEEQLVGRTSSVSSIYYLNTRDFPNGTYELTVRSTSEFDNTQSNSIRLQIQNEAVPITTTQSNSDSLIAEERELLKITPEVLRQTQQLASDSPTQSSDGALVSQSSSSTSNLRTETLDTALNGPIKRLTLEKLGSDSVLLDRLFTRYAAAIQSGNPDMIREARNSIASYQRAIVELALASPEDRFIADDLAKSLQEEIDQITAKVDTFESLRRERSAGVASTDTDGDGITDTDERVLFGTDPFRADTDGDGFTDGAEIIRGFNPNDAASEAVIAYKSPKETIGIAANENLQVLSVTPDIVLSDIGTDTTEVQTKVSGKALPNSFVTLYVFSTPTIVTVRTEADGSFEYTFSKELEDGEHQVFVALTDNTGDIVAQSAPFTFVKQAEAFTAVDAEAVISDTQSTELSGSGASSLQTVLSMSVLALGVLLIMLGVGLRSNRPEQIQLEATT